MECKSGWGREGVPAIHLGNSLGFPSLLQKRVITCKWVDTSRPSQGRRLFLQCQCLQFVVRWQEQGHRGHTVSVVSDRSSYSEEKWSTMEEISLSRCVTFYVHWKHPRVYRRLLRKVLTGYKWLGCCFLSENTTVSPWKHHCITLENITASHP